MLHCPPDSTASLRHLAFLYRGPSEYVAAAAGFITAGLAADERVVVAVPEQKAQALRSALGTRADSVTFVDITHVGRNPARMLPALQALVCSSDRRARVLGEPIWPGRSDPEMREATRHEALVNLALADANLTILCPYDSAVLPTGVIANACRTHPTLLRGEGEESSIGYAGPHAMPAECDLPLAPPPQSAQMVTYRDELRAVRCMVASRAGQAGLMPVRTADLVLAVSELAANTLVHTSGGGTVWIWQSADEIICQVQDLGHITDPLAGRRMPNPESSGGHGLWLVNRFCDLTELRTSPDGTTVRMHMSLTEDWQ